MPTWLSSAADILGILSAVLAAIFAIRTYLELRSEKRRLKGLITIQLSDGARSYSLPVPVRRSELSRAEVLGRLGMVPVKVKKNQPKEQPRFSIKHLHSEEFLRRLDEIKDDHGDTVLLIPCTKDEYEQFEI